MQLLGAKASWFFVNSASKIATSRCNSVFVLESYTTYLPGIKSKTCWSVVEHAAVQ